MTDIAVAGTFRLADVFSKAFSIYGRRIVPFVVLTVLASIPYYIALFAIGTPTVGRIPRADVFTSYYVLRMGLAALDVATKSFVSGAVTYGVVQELRGEAFSISGSLGVALRRLLPMLGILLVFAVVFILGMAVLAVMMGLVFAALGAPRATSPALAAVIAIVMGVVVLTVVCIAACMFYVVMPVCVAEKAGVFTSMSRSRFLTKGHRWQVFGTLLLVLVATFVLGAIVAIAFIKTGLTGVTIATQVLTAFVSAFTGVLIGVFYFDLRVAKEGVDIDKIAGVFD